MKAIVVTFNGDILSNTAEKNLAFAIEQAIKTYSAETTTIGVDLLSNNEVATILCREVIAAKASRKVKTVANAELVNNLCSCICRCLAEKQAEVSSINVIQLLLTKADQLNEHPGTKLLTIERSNKYEDICSEYGMKWLPKIIYDIHKALPLY